LLIGKIKIFFKLFIVINALVLAPSFVSATYDEFKTINVDDNVGADYFLIQDAIDAAEPGDTIYVNDGTYFENIKIDKSIYLIGENKYTTIIDGGGKDDVVYISSNNVVLKNFTIKNSGNENYHDGGIDLRSGYCNISKNIIMDNFVGINIGYRGGHNVIFSNEISNNKYAGARVAFSNNIISNNTISHNGIGLDLFSFPPNIVTSNQIICNNEGIRFEETSFPDELIYEIKYNEISQNGLGLTSSMPSDKTNVNCENHIHHNNFRNNSGHDFKYVNNYFENNYWDHWLGLTFTFLSSFPCHVPGMPVVKLFPTFFYIWHWNLDRSPLREPLDIIAE